MPTHTTCTCTCAENPLHGPDRGDFVDPTADAAFDRGFRVGIETAMKMLEASQPRFVVNPTAVGGK